MSYGDDVITRIVFSQKELGLQKLQRSVVSTINQVIHRLLKRHKLSVEEISHLIVAGNTTMTHLFYGIDPRHIRLSLTPHRGQHSADAGPGTGYGGAGPRLCLQRQFVSSYVGGDIVSGVLASAFTRTQN